MDCYYPARLIYNGTATSYLQDTTAGLPVVLQETVGASTPSSYFYSLGSTSPLLQTTASGIVAWYHRDGLGSMRVMSDSTGSTLNTATYSAFGTTTAQTGTTSNSHLFAGEQIDPTGLSFNRARYYDSTTGRFTQRDTFFGSATSPQSLNRFAYVQNNPTGLVDPDGNAPHKWCQTEDDSGDCPSDGSGGGQSGTCADPTYAQTYPEECGGAKSDPGDSAPDNKMPAAPKGDPGPAPDNKMPSPVAKPACQQQPNNCRNCRIEIRIKNSHLLIVFTGAELVPTPNGKAVFEGYPVGYPQIIEATERSYDSRDDLAGWSLWVGETEPGSQSNLVLLDGPQACAKEELLRASVFEINNWQKRYYIDRRNSNTTARTLLHDAGIQEQLPPGAGSMLTIGWNRYMMGKYLDYILPGTGDTNIRIDTSP